MEENRKLLLDFANWLRSFNSNRYNLLEMFDDEQEKVVDAYLSQLNKRKILDRRKIERREPKRGVNIRHDDEHYIPKRVRYAKNR